MDGILIIRKPAGPTSHDIVNEVRHIFGQRKVGHAGTLDPMATGVLIVCLGKATRVVDYLMGLPKEYRARMILGRATDTQDSTGNIISERDSSHITREMLEQAASRFVGEIEQVPPMTSAIKHQGKPLYKFAREGKSVERAPRKVTVWSIQVTDFVRPAMVDAQHLVEAELVVCCSSGTYIRTLCADIGEVLGCGAHMSALERTKIGRFSIEQAVTTDDLKEAKAAGQLENLLISIEEALADMPAAVVSAEDVDKLLHGRTVRAMTDAKNDTIVRALAPNGKLLAIGSVSQKNSETLVKPRKVLASADT
jgi:tRNA pseudouridine55 synthase